MSEQAEIGVVALQGGVIEHCRHLSALGIRHREVRYPTHLEGLRGLILPGGESTCLGRLLRLTGLDRAIVEAFEDRGLRLWGTCAGAILLADDVEGESPHLALMDMTIRRNAFGSQLDSFRVRTRIPEVAPGELPLVFIRAPQIVRTGPAVHVLLRQDDYVAAAVSTKGILATVFHPELAEDLSFHRYFARMCEVDVVPDAPTTGAPFLALSRNGTESDGPTPKGNNLPDS